ncbi:MAG: sulfatase-like hydrolase/transferase, partial [Sedimentisphaerales bacterium]|nr:sulfatase-like hydrolase/transferase [Sedimentisphaerales bacterium]
DRTIGIPTEQKPDDMFGTPGPMIKGWRLDRVMPTLTQKAVEYVTAESDVKPFNKKSTRPFFLYFPLTAPHTPIAPAKQFQGTSKAGAYGDYVQQVDWTVGQIITALRQAHQADNTLVIFTSDNGSPGRDGTNMNGPTSSVRKYGHNPSYIYRGIKADIWEGGHHVAFIARWPGRIKPGSKNDETVCLTDFMATVADILGEKLPMDAGEDSFSLLPYLLGEVPKELRREAVVHHSINGLFAIRCGKWKLIDGAGSGGWSGKGDGQPGQLYDMQANPSEKNNLYNNPEHQHIVKRLKALLTEYKKNGRSRPMT